MLMSGGVKRGYIMLNVATTEVSLDIKVPSKSIFNVTPADVYFGRDKDILREREKITEFSAKD